MRAKHNWPYHKEKIYWLFFLFIWIANTFGSIYPFFVYRWKGLDSFVHYIFAILWTFVFIILSVLWLTTPVILAAILVIPFYIFMWIYSKAEFGYEYPRTIIDGNFLDKHFGKLFSYNLFVISIIILIESIVTKSPWLFNLVSSILD